MADLRKKRPSHDVDVPDEDWVVSEELIGGDFKSDNDQTMIYAAGLCNRIKQCSGVDWECK